MHGWNINERAIIAGYILMPFCHEFIFILMGNCASFPTKNVVHVTGMLQTTTCMLLKTCMLQSCMMNVILRFSQHACHMHVHMHVM